VVPCPAGERIDLLLDLQGKTRTELALAIGVHYVSLHQILTGVHQPKLATASAIAKALRVPMDRIFR